jgi:hypothetical protein
MLEGAFYEVISRKVGFGEIAVAEGAAEIFVSRNLLFGEILLVKSLVFVKCFVHGGFAFCAAKV